MSQRASQRLEEGALEWGQELIEQGQAELNLREIPETEGVRLLDERGNINDA